MKDSSVETRTGPPVFSRAQPKSLNPIRPPRKGVRGQPDQRPTCRPWLTEDKSVKCPACGHRDGKIRLKTPLNGRTNQTSVLIEHDCQVCDARWHEPTVVSAEKWLMKGQI